MVLETRSKYPRCLRFGIGKRKEFLARLSPPSPLTNRPLKLLKLQEHSNSDQRYQPRSIDQGPATKVQRSWESAHLCKKRHISLGSSHCSVPPKTSNQTPRRSELARHAMIYVWTAPSFSLFTTKRNR
ncbi:hypothetical protein AN958_09704 [Leucoagaricus sp. SymC.cos]|nr:hypothetical protein AN958_09704 [Leucoagaricus sp. SymC.cos]